MKREIGWIAGVAFVAGLAMMLVGLRHQSLVDAQIDPYQYGKIAHGFLEHGFDKLTRRAASLYPTFLSFVYGAGLGDRAVQLIQCAMHAATCVMVFTLGRHLYNARTGLLAGLFCAVNPMLLRYVADLHMETWLTFWFVATIWRAVRFDEDRSLKNGVVLGVVGDDRHPVEGGRAACRRRLRARVARAVGAALERGRAQGDGGPRRNRPHVGRRSSRRGRTGTTR